MPKWKTKAWSVLYHEARSVELDCLFRMPDITPQKHARVGGWQHLLSLQVVDKISAQHQKEQDNGAQVQVWPGDRQFSDKDSDCWLAQRRVRKQNEYCGKRGQ